MKASSITIIVSLLLIGFLFLYNTGSDTTEGFAGNLPTSAVTITGFRIYSSLATISSKLPFVHTNFSQIKDVASGSVSWTAQTMPNDPAQKLYEFVLGESLRITLDEQMMTEIKAASIQLFNREDALGYITSTGDVYPSTSTVLKTPAGTPSTDASGNRIP